MPLYLEDFIDLLTEICKERNLKCTVKSSVVGGVITGTSAVLGGLLLGPLGLAVGGAVGGIVAATTSQNFSSVPEVIMNMSREEKQKLCNKVVHAFRDFGITDIATVAAVIASQNSFKSIAIREVKGFLTNEMGLQVY